MSAVPEALTMLPDELLPNIRHQSGPGRGAETVQLYHGRGVDAEIIEYIDDMPQAYRWADVIVARSGAMSLAEISAVGLAALLVPFPHAARDHQRVNAQQFENNDCALVCNQGEEFIRCLFENLKKMLGDRKLIRQMSDQIRENGKTRFDRAGRASLHGSHAMTSRWK